MSREFLGAEEQDLGSPADDSDDVDLGTFQTDGRIGAPFLPTPSAPSRLNLQEITDWATRDLTGGQRADPKPVEQPLPPLTFGRPSSADVVGTAEDEPPSRATTQVDRPLPPVHQDDFVEDLTAEDPDAPPPAADRPRAARPRGRPPLVAIAVGALFIALLGAAFAYEQTSRFIQARAVDDAQVIGYLSYKELVFDTDQAQGATVKGDFFLTTSASMPLTLQRLDLGYGPVDVGGKVVLRGDKMTKVRLSLQAACGPPTSTPAADVVSPDGRHYRLPLAGPSDQVSDFAARFWCGGDATSSFGLGSATSSYLDPSTGSSQPDAAGVRVVEMSVHGRAFRMLLAGDAQTPATAVSLLPRNSPSDPRARSTWKVTVDPPGVMIVTAGHQAAVTVELRYTNCRRTDPTPALDPVRMLAVPVGSPDAPRDSTDGSIDGWRVDVVTQAARNALGADCTG